jgi:hypothetical protein
MFIVAKLHSVYHKTGPFDEEYKSAWIGAYGIIFGRQRAGIDVITHKQKPTVKQVDCLWWDSLGI